MLEKLTKREKVLIYIMICVLILALGVFFVIKPAASWNSSVNSKYEKIKLQKMEMETTISQKQTAKGEIKEYEKKIKNMKSKLSFAMFIILFISYIKKNITFNKRYLIRMNTSG